MKTKLRKVLALVLALTMVMIFAAGCGKKAPTGNSQNTNDEETQKEKPKVAVILQGAISDMSWNKTAYDGLKKIEALGAEVSYQENVPISSVSDSINTYATEGYDLIFLSTNGYEDFGAQAAPQYPDTQFVLINGIQSHGDNLVALQIADEQQGFLMGAIAALTSKSKNVGFIGGEEITPIINGRKGFEQGVKYVDPSVKINATLTGNFDNINQAKETAKAMIDAGVDVVAPMANAAALGVLQAAEESGKCYAIGSSIGQQQNAPNSLIIEIGKDTSIAYEAAYKMFLEGKLGKDPIKMGADKGVVFLSDWLDASKDIPEDVKAKVKTIYDDLASGKIKIDLN